MEGPGRPRSWALVAILLGLLGGLVATEGILQGLALVTWWRHRPADEAVPAGARVVLCVGDSFTYGLRAEGSRSYPRGLEARLRAAAPEAGWRVVADAWPGRTSAQVVANLPGRLREHRPEIVVVLVGLNDLWNLTGPDAAVRTAAPADPSRFVWTWRTARLGAIVAAAVRARGRSPASAPADPVAGAAPPTLRTLEDVEATLSDPGRRREQRRVLDALRTEIAASGDSARILRLLRAADEVGLQLLVLEEGERLMRARGPSGELCRLLFRPLTIYRPMEEARAMARLAVRLDPTYAQGYRALAQAEWDCGDVEASARASLLAFRLDGGAKKLEAQFRWRNLVRTMDQARFEALAAEVLADPEARATALRAFDASRGRSPIENRTVEYLEEAVRLARRSGARPVLLTYPMVGPRAPASANECVRDVAERTGADLVDLRSAFERAVETVAESALFVPDGHCSAEGYDLMAAEVAALLLGPDPAPAASAD
jgi:lysophospholipase L1-like esterase